MNRIDFPATIETSPARSQAALRGIEAKFKAVPNFWRMLSVSPAALQGVLGAAGALVGGQLDARTRERIALAVANVNGCDYCNAAHTAGGRAAGLDPAELAAARRGQSQDDRAEAALRFAQKLAERRGAVDDEDLEALRQAGYSDPEIVEIVVHVGFNTLTNFVNEALGTPIDFPEVEPATRVA